MLNAFLSVWHVDILVWCQLVLIGILAVGTLALTINGARAHRSELSVTFAGLVAVVAAAFTNNIAVLALTFALAVLAATCLALHAQRAADEKARKAILALCIGSVGLFTIGAALLFTSQYIQWAFIVVAVATLSSFGIFFMKTRFTSFVGGAAPVVFFIALLRVKQITDGAMADDGVWTNNFFLGFGALIILMAVVKLVFKKKRQLLSISSVQHIGLVAFMIGAGPAGTIPAIIHLVGQAVAHSGLWYSTQSSAVVQSNTTLKYLSGALFASLLGAPFSVLFVSELIGVGYALQAHLILALLVFFALAIINVYLIRGVITLTAGSEPSESTPMTRHQKILAGVLAVHVAIMFGAGTYLLTQQGIQFAVTAAENIASL